ncbi:hypothetical protein EON65_51095 [archaeon]|nr:MAG: hypothetical protein EON65_51095 [archaeon]
MKNYEEFIISTDNIDRSACFYSCEEAVSVVCQVSCKKSISSVRTTSQYFTYKSTQSNGDDNWCKDYGETTDAYGDRADIPYYDILENMRQDIFR